METSRLWFFASVLHTLGAAAHAQLQFQQLAPSPAPSPRHSGAMAVGVQPLGVVLFGGVDASGQVLSDTWIWHWEDAGSWSPYVGPSPTPRHSASMLAIGGPLPDVVLYGGQDPSGAPLSDTWIWDGGTWQIVTANLPPARWGAALAGSPFGPSILFGGMTPSGALGDTWRRTQTGTGWQAVPEPGPLPRAYAAMAPVPSGVLLYGGADTNGAFGDTWIFDGAQWHPLGIPGPPPRSRATLIPYGSGAVLIGGLNQDGLECDDLWVWDGQWTDRSDITPRPSPRHSAHLNAAPWGALIIGGQASGQTLTDAWFLGAALPGCAANCDESTQPPVLNIADFTCFLDRFAAGCYSGYGCYANCDQSTTAPILSIADFSCFLQQFATGCN